MQVSVTGAPTQSWPAGQLPLQGAEQQHKPVLGLHVPPFGQPPHVLSIAHVALPMHKPVLPTPLGPVGPSALFHKQYGLAAQLVALPTSAQASMSQRPNLVSQKQPIAALQPAALPMLGQLFLHGPTPLAHWQLCVTGDLPSHSSCVFAGEQ